MRLRTATVAAISKPTTTSAATIRTTASVDMSAESVSIDESVHGEEKERATHSVGGPLESRIGGDLLSQALSSQVPSAQRGLTALFGMGRGVSPSQSHRKP